MSCIQITSHALVCLSIFLAFQRSLCSLIDLVLSVVDEMPRPKMLRMALPRGEGINACFRCSKLEKAPVVYFTLSFCH